MKTQRHFKTREKFHHSKTKPHHSKTKPLSKFHLTPQQQETVDYFTNSTFPGKLDWHGTGSGKTRGAFAAAVALHAPTLVVGPTGMRGDYEEELSKMKLKPEQRQLFEFVSFQYFLRHTPESKKFLIVDEAHTIRNEKGKIYKKIADYAKSIPKVSVLTATPVINAPRDIAPLINLIIRGKIKLKIKRQASKSMVRSLFDKLSDKLTGKTSEKWEEWSELPMGEAFDHEFGVTGFETDVAKQAWKQVLPCCLSYFTIDLNKDPDFPKSIIERVFVPMDSVQQEAYDKWEKKKLTVEMAQKLTKKELDPIELFKIPQFQSFLDGGRKLCNNYAFGKRLDESGRLDEEDELFSRKSRSKSPSQSPTQSRSKSRSKSQTIESIYDWQKKSIIYEYESHPKINRIIDYIRHSTGQVMVYSNYLDNGLYIIARLLDYYNISYSIFTGKESVKQKIAAKTLYNQKKVRVFLVSSAGSLGLNLQNTESIHVLEPHWNQGKIIQVIGRGIRRKSHIKKNAIVRVYFYYSVKNQSKLVSLFNRNMIRETADMWLYRISLRKHEINETFMKNCILYKLHGDHKCTK